MLESSELRNIADDLRSMRHTLFFPHVNIEYVDIGGEPLGFDHLFHGWFGNEPLDEFFRIEETPDY